MGILKLKKNLNSNNTETYKKNLSGEDAFIVVQNSFCYLENFSNNQIELIKKALTYDNQEVIYELQQMKIQLGLAFRYKNYKKIGWLKSKVADLEENLKICWLKGNRFPTGHLLLVKEALLGIKFDIEDLRENNAPKIDYKWNVERLPSRYYQDEMVSLGVEHHRGVFESAVGTGKTFIAQELIYQLKVPTLVVLPSKDLSIQTFNSFSETFGEDSVELVDGVKKAKTQKPIRICTVHTLTALEKKNALKSILENVGMICIDEVHHAGAKSYSDLLPYFNDIYYRFGFSGTFLRNDSRTLDMWGFLSTVLYRYTAVQATEEGFLTPLKVHVHQIEGLRGSTYHNEYTKNYCQNEELLSAIMNIFNNEVAEGEQLLILVGRKEKSGKVIHEYLNELGISNEYVSGDSKKDVVKQALTNFNSKKTRVLIGSSVIGEGIDIRSTDHLIMAQGGKSEIQVTQAIGRAVRLFPGKEVAHIHDFKFIRTKYLEKHLQNRLDIYKKNFGVMNISE